MMKIPLIKPDLPPFCQIVERFREVTESGQITNFGKYLNIFEEEAGRYLGTQVATVSSGTIGLILTLQSVGLEPGQKVILPSFTFMATAQAVIYANGVPLFADIDDDLTMSISDLEFLLNKHEDVAAVLPVHTYGLACRVEDIQRLVSKASKKRSKPISIVYDSAHAFGAAVKDKRVGCFGDAEVFSLSVTKPLVSVEGGIVSSRNLELVDLIKKMRNYGMAQYSYDAHQQGVNAKMSEFHAIIGLYNLRRLDNLLCERKRKAHYYIEQIHSHTSFKTQPHSEDATHTFKDFTILVPETKIEERDLITEFLNQRGIETRTYYHPAVHQQSFFQRFADRPLPRTESFSRRVINIPFYASIKEEEIDYIVDSLIAAERRFL